MLPVPPLNQYVSSKLVVSSFNTYQDALLDLRGRIDSKKYHKSSKQLLSLVRIFAVLFSFPLSALDETLISSLVTISKDIPDQDVERKVLRTCMAIFSIVLSSGESISLSPRILDEMMRLIQSEIVSQSGYRLALAWRMIGQLSRKRPDNAFLLLLRDAIVNLEYPVKSKASLLFGQKKLDKEFEHRLAFWSATLSALRRTGQIPPSECIKTLFTAMSSKTPTIRRPALVLFERVFTDENFRGSSSSQTLNSIASEFAAKLLVVRETLDVNFDALSCAYAFRAVAAVASNNSISFAIAADVFRAALSFLCIESVAVCTCAAQCLVDSCSSSGRSWPLLRMIQSSESLTGAQNEAFGVSGRGFVRKLHTLVDTLQKLIVATPTGDFNFFLLLHACVNIAKLLIQRPEFEGDLPSQGGGLGLLPALWKPVFAIYKQLLDPSNSGTIPNAVTMAKAPVPGFSCPHLVAEVLVALVWLAPSERYFDRTFGYDTHMSLWSKLVRSFISPWLDLSAADTTATNTSALPLPYSLFLTHPISTLDILGADLSRRVGTEFLARVGADERVHISVQGLPPPSDDSKAFFIELLLHVGQHIFDTYPVVESSVLLREIWNHILHHATPGRREIDSNPALSFSPGIPTNTGDTNVKFSLQQDNMFSEGTNIDRDDLSVCYFASAVLHASVTRAREAKHRHPTDRTKPWSLVDRLCGHIFVWGGSSPIEEGDRQLLDEVIVHAVEEFKHTVEDLATHALSVQTLLVIMWIPSPSSFTSVLPLEGIYDANNSRRSSIAGLTASPLVVRSIRWLLGLSEQLIEIMHRENLPPRLEAIESLIDIASRITVALQPPNKNNKNADEVNKRGHTDVPEPGAIPGVFTAPSSSSSSPHSRKNLISSLNFADVEASTIASSYTSSLPMDTVAEDGNACRESDTVGAVLHSLLIRILAALRKFAIASARQPIDNVIDNASSRLPADVRDALRTLEFSFVGGEFSGGAHRIIFPLLYTLAPRGETFSSFSLSDIAKVDVNSLRQISPYVELPFPSPNLAKKVTSHPVPLYTLSPEEGVFVSGAHVFDFSSSYSAAMSDGTPVRSVVSSSVSFSTAGAAGSTPSTPALYNSSKATTSITANPAADLDLFFASSLSASLQAHSAKAATGANSSSSVSSAGVVDLDFLAGDAVISSQTKYAPGRADVVAHIPLDDFSLSRTSDHVSQSSSVNIDPSVSFYTTPALTPPTPPLSAHSVVASSVPLKGDDFVLLASHPQSAAHTSDLNKQLQRQLQDGSEHELFSMGITQSLNVTSGVHSSALVADPVDLSFLTTSTTTANNTGSHTASTSATPGSSVTFEAEAPLLAKGKKRISSVPVPTLAPPKDPSIITTRANKRRPASGAGSAFPGAKDADLLSVFSSLPATSNIAGASPIGLTTAFSTAPMAIPTYSTPVPTLDPFSVSVSMQFRGPLDMPPAVPSPQPHRQPPTAFTNTNASATANSSNTTAWNSFAPSHSASNSMSSFNPSHAQAGHLNNPFSPSTASSSSSFPGNATGMNMIAAFEPTVSTASFTAESNPFTPLEPSLFATAHSVAIPLNAASAAPSYINPFEVFVTSDQEQNQAEKKKSVINPFA